jgi:surface antigen
MKKMMMASLIMVISFASVNASAKNNKQAGAIVGAVVGATIGSDLSNGDGLGTVLGAIAGAAIGSSIGQDLDNESRQEMSYAQARALERSERSSWRSSRYRGDFIVLGNGYYNSQECRSYRSEIYSSYGQLVEVREGTTCYGSRGWYEQNYSYVVWR